MIAATCATIAAVLASAPGGSIVTLAGDCPAIVVTRTYAPPITVRAAGATVRGLVINGGGVVWQGGILRASGGEEGLAGKGYGALVRLGRGVVFDGVTFTDAKKALVISKASGVTVKNSKFVGVREDGIIASTSTGLNITRNEFRDFRPRPPQCRLGMATEPLKRRECSARGGEWTDGDHPDAVQIRNGIEDAVISFNRIDGTMQGIGQMEATTDLPLKRVRIEGNRIRNTYPHSITLGSCDGCSVVDNDVARVGGGKTVLRFQEGMTASCGNAVADGGKGRGACRK